jgi:hypothetical protein
LRRESETTNNPPQNLRAKQRRQRETFPSTLPLASEIKMRRKDAPRNARPIYHSHFTQHRTPGLELRIKTRHPAAHRGKQALRHRNWGAAPCTCHSITSLRGAADCGCRAPSEWPAIGLFSGRIIESKLMGFYRSALCAFSEHASISLISCH